MHEHQQHHPQQLGPDGRPLQPQQQAYPPAAAQVRAPWPDQARPHQQFSADVRGQHPAPPPQQQQQQAQQPQQHVVQQYAQQAPAQPHGQFQYAQPGTPHFAQQAPATHAQPAPPQHFQQHQHQQHQQQHVAPPMQGGFVQPGQPSMQRPFAAHDGVIGQAQQYGHQAAPQQLPPGFVQQQVAHPPQQLQQQYIQQQHAGSGAHGGAMHGMAPQQYADPRTQLPGGMQQQYGFATPSGMQLVSTNGGAAHAMHVQQQVHAAHQQAPRPQLAPAVQAVVPPMPRRRSRMRWEVIVPMAAVFFLLVAIGVLVINFDEITGRTTAADKAGAQKAQAGDAAGGGASGSATSSESEVRRLLRLGR
jgi:hypothetical protein